MEKAYKADISKMQQKHEEELNSIKADNEKISNELSKLQAAVESDYVNKSTYDELNSKCFALLDILKKEGLLEKYNITINPK